MALFAQRVHQAEKHLALLFVERGRRLIHDDDLGVERHGLGDFHELLLGDVEVANEAVRRDAVNTASIPRAVPRKKLI